ncbi:MAG: hypothetical protein SGJ20_13075 [Planctomycetota bacterium]|nr:hypothetical protein [Planctomycetota bacterium]
MLNYQRHFWSLMESGMPASGAKVSITESVGRWIAHLCALAGLALSQMSDRQSEVDRQIDPDFQGWLRNDPMVTEDPANRYGKGVRGYLTSNGRGSLEIGAADD